MTEDWRDDAKCAEYPPELFFPQPGDRGQVLQALGVCFTCPVMAACDEWATRTRQVFGVSGGKHRETVQVTRPPKHGGARQRARLEYCRAGLHQLTDDNVYLSVRNARVARSCKACALARAAARKARMVDA